MSDGIDSLALLTGGLWCTTVILTSLLSLPTNYDKNDIPGDLRLFLRHF